MTHYVFVIDDAYLYKCVAGEQREAEKRASAHYPNAKDVKLVGKSNDPNDCGWSIYEKWEKKLAKPRPVKADKESGAVPAPAPPPAPKLIYTVGKTEVYGDYMAKDKNPEKAKGGSVWRTRDDARGYLLETKQDKTFSVYGIEADWDKDTEPTLEGQWRALTRKARLIKLEARNG